MTLVHNPFWDSIERHVRLAGMGMAPNCKQLLQQMADEVDSHISRQPDRRKEAEANVVQFVQFMIDNARKKGYTELHEDTFMEARASLCPIWPIC